MATKTFKVALSLDNPRLIQSGIDVRSFDKQSIKIAIELTKNSQTYQIPTGAQIKISLLKLARQEQKIILDVPFTSAEAIEWLVPDYLDGYQGEVRVGVYLIVGTENIDVGYFNIASKVSDIDNAAEEFTDSVMQGWDQIEADLAEIRASMEVLEVNIAGLYTEKEQMLDDLATIKGTAMDNLYAEKETALEALEQDFSERANNLETTYAPRLTALETNTAGLEIDSEGDITFDGHKLLYFTESEIW